MITLEELHKAITPSVEPITAAVLKLFERLQIFANLDWSLQYRKLCLTHEDKSHVFLVALFSIRTETAKEVWSVDIHFFEPIVVAGGVMQQLTSAITYDNPPTDTEILEWVAKRLDFERNKIVKAWLA